MPIQHISDRVLRAMNRRDTAADIRSAVERLRRAVPDIVLRTTVITGFPGETEDEFEELRAFIRETRFERLGVFAYSREEGTPAYDLPDQIPEKLKRKRHDVLMREQRKIHTAYNRAQLGRTFAPLSARAMIRPEVRITAERMPTRRISTDESFFRRRAV